MAGILGAALATLAALALSAQAIFIRVGTRSGSSTEALVVVLLVNIAVLVPVAAVAGYPEYRLTPTAISAFAGAGLVGTLLGRIFFYGGIERIGASRAEPIKASMPLHASLLAVVILGESLSSGRLAGIVLIVAGVALVSRETTRTDAGVEGISAVGVAFPLAAAFFFGLEPLFAKTGFAQGTPVLVGLAVKTIVAAVGFLGYLRWQGALPGASALAANRRWYLAAGVANTVFLLGYYAGLSVAPVAVVVPIMQTSPLFVAGLSVLFLQRLEQVTPRLAAASTVVVAGAVAVTLSG